MTAALWVLLVLVLFAAAGFGFGLWLSHRRVITVVLMGLVRVVGEMLDQLAEQRAR